MSENRILVIAHRGASGYLPEHTLAAKTLAFAMGADYLEQDVVATRDDELVVLHDVYLDRVSDVAARFPGRARADGRYYARDFDLDELRGLQIYERFDEAGQPAFPGRYPVGSGDFRIHTLEEELELVGSLVSATGRGAGVYPEIKRPAWHRSEGIDIAPRVLSALDRYGYRRREDPVYLQCFDPAELRRIRHELGSELKLIQLIGDNSWAESDANYDSLRRPEMLRKLARVVDGIGPWLPQCFDLTNGRPRPSGLVAAARRAGLAVHPYTVRADSLPGGFPTHDDLVRFCADELGVDGLFSDFPDLTRRALERATTGQRTG
jgi:glycerophosphoryl diester phosphodiesterase